MKYALFDYDGTLAPGDSIVPFMLYAVQKGKAPVSRLIVAGVTAILPYLFPKRFTHGWAKRKALAFLKGRSRAEMDAFALTFFHDKVEKKLYADGQRELARLKQEGYHILLVSASPDVYLNAIGHALGAEAVLATTCGLEADGETYTGLVGENCKGVEKPCVSPLTLPRTTPIWIGKPPRLRRLRQRRSHDEPDGASRVRQPEKEASASPARRRNRPLGLKRRKYGWQT